MADSDSQHEDVLTETREPPRMGSGSQLMFTPTTRAHKRLLGHKPDGAAFLTRFVVYKAHRGALLPRVLRAGALAACFLSFPPPRSPAATSLPAAPPAALRVPTLGDGGAGAPCAFPKVISN